MPWVPALGIDRRIQGDNVVHMHLPLSWSALVIGLGVVQVHAAQMKVACVGDSITEGTFLSNPASESYPGKLQQLLGTNYLVKNFGVSGRTLLKQGDFPYWKEAAFKQSHDFAPDIVTIMLGTNDSKPQNWRYGTNFLTDYTGLIASYQELASHPRILLFTPCPVFGAGAYDIKPGVVATNILPLVRQLGLDLGLEIIDINGPMSGHKEWFPDTVHPNSKGTSILAALGRKALLGDATQGLAPAAEIRPAANGRVIVSWPVEWAGWVAQSASTPVAAPAAWSVVEAIATNSGSALRLGSSTAGTAKYFRLWNPAP
ncbi:MAG TPA: GDSL-type esterase/lipase family protein [Candidatus Limnocylindria bacterium]|jgi:lysophospholipase L1-like esterase|nr:GDSL-type esterase/lipase family protein [Candidatus Limnocylindria bacterium]